MVFSCTESQVINSPEEYVHLYPYLTPKPILVTDDCTFNLPHDLSVQGEVARKQENVLIDTWAALSAVCAEFLQRSPLAFQLRFDVSQLHAVIAGSGEQLPVKGEV